MVVVVVCGGWCWVAATCSLSASVLRCSLSSYQFPTRVRLSYCPAPDMLQERTGQWRRRGRNGDVGRRGGGCDVTADELYERNVGGMQAVVVSRTEAERCVT